MKLKVSVQQSTPKKNSGGWNCHGDDPFFFLSDSLQLQRIGKGNAIIPRDSMSFRLELFLFLFDDAKEAFCDVDDDSDSNTVSLKEEAETEKHRLDLLKKSI